MIENEETKWILNPDDFENDQKRNIIKECDMICSFCTQKSTGSKCIKKKFKESLDNLVVKRMFVNYISIFSTISHPAIVPFFGFYKEDDYGYIIEEEIENGNLDDELKRIKEGEKNPIWDETHKYIIIYGISCAMEFLHNKQIVHRDLNSSNILLNSELYPFLSGLTFSKKINPSINSINCDLTMTTPYIMAPEFITDPYDYNKSFSVDVFSYGAIVYEIMTETKPFEKIKSTYKLLNAVVSGRRPKIPSSVDSNLQELIQTCWHQQPDSRPTFTQICDFLESNSCDNDKIDRSDFEYYMKLVKPFRPSSQKD